MYILGSSHGLSLQMYPQTTLLVTKMYTKIHIHKYKITQLIWIHLVHTGSIWTFDTVIGWILLNLSTNWQFHQKIAFHN